MTVVVRKFATAASIQQSLCHQPFFGFLLSSEANQSREKIALRMSDSMIGGHIMMETVMDDADLLREFVRTNSEKAFASLVAKHLNLVYSAALRQARDPHLAEEITQSVFIRLASKARSFRAGVLLSGWLYKTTRFVALENMRSEDRRRHREQNAMETLYEPQGESTWEQIAPLLDEAMAGLNDADRDAVLLRFFEKKNLKEVGLALGTSEDTAQKRVARAVEKLRTFFHRRGKLISTSVLAGGLTGFAVQAAPAGLAGSVTAAVMLSGAATSTLTIGAMKFVTWINLKSAVAGVCALAGVSVAVVQSKQAANLRAENQRLTSQMSELQKSRDAEQARFQAGKNELERLRSEAGDVYKLRGEVAALRRAKSDSAKVAEENEKLRQQIQQIATEKSLQEKTDVQAQREAEKQAAIAKMNNLKVGVGAIMQYVLENATNVPTSFDALMPYLRPQDQAPFLEDQFKIVFNGNLNSLSRPESTIVIEEKEPTQTLSGNWVKGYGFADGHSEIHSAQTQDGFASWEQERMIPAVPVQ